MNLYDEINRQPSRADQLKVGLTMLVGFGVFGALQMLVRHRLVVAEVLWAVGAAACLASLAPALGRRLYIGWMGLGLTLGVVTQPVVMLIAYIVLFVPLGLIFRLIRRDLMKRKLTSGATSYWEEYDESDEPAAYFGQY